jgi:trans-aconitate methyltransferase
MAETAFHVPEARLRWFSDVIVSTVTDTTAPMSILDIGCGAGDQIFDLAARLPAARFVGVDVADVNIAAAERRRLMNPHAARIRFCKEGYRTFAATEPFDLAFSFSVLQWVPGGVAGLAQRINDDIRPGGVFVNAMPRSCGYNAWLMVVRRLLRTIRSTAADRVLLSIARLLHGKNLDSALLSERISYAYAVPLQWEDDLATPLERCGWSTIRREHLPHASLAQPKHALRIMRRGRA